MKVKGGRADLILCTKDRIYVYLIKILSSIWVMLCLLSEKDMRMLLAEKSRLISEKLEVSIGLSDVALDSLLDISYTNLGIRHPMNCIRSLTINTLAERYFDDDFDKSKYKIVISQQPKRI